jgi:phosphoribosylformimino-5-aminoimidazole carboxamide ribotide isomerase
VILFPAIDLRGGRCVRLIQGRFDEETTYSDDPVAMAKRWADEGAEWLHVVDLDGAKAGSPQQLDIVSRIVAAVPIRVEIGGGYRSLEHVQRALDCGLERVILGSVAVSQPELAKEAFKRFGDRIVLGLDAKNEQVAVHGWVDVSEHDLFSLAQAMEQAGARRIIYTDIGRDGLLSGVNVESTQRLSDAVSIPVIASGGVGSLDDLKRLSQMTGRGVEGVIIGKALYSGAFTLRDALASLAGG